MSVDSVYASGNPPSLDSKYLGNKERVVQNTLMTMKQIFERTDEGIGEMSPEMHDEVLSFERAFYNPVLIGRRSRLDTSGVRPASLNDILLDFRRAFVLYADILISLPEFCRMNHDDRMALAKARFAPYYWWLTANWAVRANAQGFCYSNGSYFSADIKPQVFPDLRGISEKSVVLLKEPLEELQLDEDEVTLAGLFFIFADEVPTLSPEGCQHLDEARSHYQELLQFVCSRYRGELSAANRIANITTLLSGITNLTYMSGENLELPEVFRVVESPDWIQELRLHQYQSPF